MLDLSPGELSQAGGKVVRLAEQPFRLLVALVERPGEVVTREELRRQLWPNDTIVDFEHSINTGVKRLRRALGDSADNPQYIETLARRGYRWKVAVERWDSTTASLSTSPQEPMSASDNLIGKGVAHYRVLGILDKAEDVKLGRRVALKFLPEGLVNDSTARERFECEARAASSLNHPNICTIYEVEEHEGNPFIVMELLEGQTLRDRIGGGGDLRATELLRIAIQVVKGLETAHRNGIIHRDIKPANIFITKEGEAKILDFGVAMLALPQTGPIVGATAKVGEENLKSPIAAMGTVAYMSPEQTAGKDLDARTDLFSLGAVLYEMATAKQAVTGSTTTAVRGAILECAPALPGRVASELPAKLAEVISKALEKDRNLRYQSASQMRADLERLLRDTDDELKMAVSSTAHDLDARGKELSKIAVAEVL